MFFLELDSKVLGEKWRPQGSEEDGERQEGSFEQDRSPMEGDNGGDGMFFFRFSIIRLLFLAMRK